MPDHVPNNVPICNPRGETLAFLKSKCIALLILQDRGFIYQSFIRYHRSFRFARFCRLAGVNNNSATEFWDKNAQLQLNTSVSFQSDIDGIYSSSPYKIEQYIGGLYSGAIMYEIVICLEHADRHRHVHLSIPHLCHRCSPRF
jgi:hypothetical protein